jgi:hypothetical protein
VIEDDFVSSVYFLSLFFCYGLQCPKVDHFSLLTRLLGLLPAFTFSFGKFWPALQKMLRILYGHGFNGCDSPCDFTQETHGPALHIRVIRVIGGQTYFGPGVVTGAAFVTHYFTREGDEPEPHVLSIRGNFTGYS